MERCIECHRAGSIDRTQLPSEGCALGPSNLQGLERAEGPVKEMEKEPYAEEGQ